MSYFQFNTFTVYQDRCAMKVGTDAVTLGAWCPLPENCQRILDIGTGTGVIALLAAQRALQAKVVGVEIDKEAALQAHENFVASPYADRLSTVASSIQDYAAQNPGKFSLIITNPPFFSGGAMSEQLNRQTARHTVRLSHTDLLRAVQQLLDKEGLFCLVLPKIEGLRFIEIAATLKFKLKHRLDMRPRADKPVRRLFLAFSPGEVEEVQQDEIVQYDEGQQWTAAFSDLVGRYHRDR